MALQKASGLYDVVVTEQSTEEEIGGLIVQSLLVKGFCVLSPGLDEGLISRAAQDAENLKYYEVNDAIAEGLLGVSGSAKIADMESKLDDEARSEGMNLVAVDKALTKIGYHVAPFVHLMNFDMKQRTGAVVHQAAEVDEEKEPPTLTEREVTKWQSQFLRHKVMAIIFLGPKTGLLELQPYFSEDSEPHTVMTSPGSMVLVRADTMSHKLTGVECHAVSTFFMASEQHKYGNYRLTPPSKRIEEWAERRLEYLKDIESPTNPVWDPMVPRCWQQATNHSYHKGQMTGIAGVSCHLPSSYNPSAFAGSMNTGVDYSSEVWFSRWNVDEMYDPNPESWKWGKSYCKHCNMMEGTELFDNKFFMLSPNESRGLDPHIRHLLEVGYESFADMGLQKKNLMMANYGWFVGGGNDEWCMMPGGFNCTTGNICMWAGRVSFSLGMKGPSIAITSEAAGGLTAMFLATECVQQKGKATNAEVAAACGANICLQPRMWSTMYCMTGRFTAKGCSRSFDATGDGFIRGEGVCCAAVRPLQKVVGVGQLGNFEKQIGNGYLYGTVASAFMNTNGGGASLTSVYGPSQQDCISSAIKNACINPADVDGVSTAAAGQILYDAIEVSSHWRAHRSDITNESLALTAGATCYGYQIEAAGMTQVIMNLFQAHQGSFFPVNHLRVINPHINPFSKDGSATNIMQEVGEFEFKSSFMGAFNTSNGGSNVYLISWAQVDQAHLKSAADSHSWSNSEVYFWPGGGGKLEDNQQPLKKDGYFIAGTWDCWESPVKMQVQSTSSTKSVYAFPVILGENRMEQFQIWLDGKSERAIHPGEPEMASGSAVLGPDEGSANSTQTLRDGGCPTWIIDGRSYAPPPTEGGEGAVVTYTGLEAGMPGDEYLVTLTIMGRWRMVEWAKTGNTSTAIPKGRYFVAGSWNRWKLEEMKSSTDSPGTFTLDVRFVRLGGGDFQIIRDEDWSQTFYPGESGETLGPDSLSDGAAFHIDAQAGDNVKITLERSGDTKKVSHAVTSTSAVTALELQMSRRPAYYITGSWDSYTRPLEMEDSGEHHLFYITLGKSGPVSFQLLMDGRLDRAVFPTKPNASPYEDHAMRGPTLSRADLVWTIGKNSKDTPGTYEVKLLTDSNGVHKKLTWRALASNEKAKDGYTV